MRGVFFVLGAIGFDQVRIGHQMLFQRDGKRMRVGGRIIDCEPHLHMAKIDAVKSFGEMQRLAMRMAASIQPAAVIKSSRVDCEGVAFPFARRISKPCRVRI